MEIPVDDILYIVISDKLSFFHLADGSSISLFITLSELEKRLPEKIFIRISRSCIVNYHAVQSVKGGHVILHNKESLPYSRRRERKILDGWQAQGGSFSLPHPHR